MWPHEAGRACVAASMYVGAFSIWRAEVRRRSQNSRCGPRAISFVARRLAGFATVHQVCSAAGLSPLLVCSLRHLSCVASRVPGPPLLKNLHNLCVCLCVCPCVCIRSHSLSVRRQNAMLSALQRRLRGRAFRGCVVVVRAFRGCVEGWRASVAASMGAPKRQRRVWARLNGSVKERRASEAASRWRGKGAPGRQRRLRVGLNSKVETGRACLAASQGRAFNAASGCMARLRGSVSLRRAHVAALRGAPSRQRRGKRRRSNVSHRRAFAAASENRLQNSSIQGACGKSHRARDRPEYLRVLAQSGRYRLLAVVRLHVTLERRGSRTCPEQVSHGLMGVMCGEHFGRFNDAFFSSHFFVCALNLLVCSSLHSLSMRPSSRQASPNFLASRRLSLPHLIHVGGLSKVFAPFGACVCVCVCKFVCLCEREFEWVVRTNTTSIDARRSAKQGHWKARQE